MECPGRFGQYDLIRRLAVGGMAEIYLARVGGLAFEKHLVLKVIHPKFAADPEFVEMLVHEAKLLVRLTHANIAQVFDLGEQEDRYFIAMEYVEGLDVFQYLRRLRENRQQMPFEVAAFIISEVCSALDYAHNRRDDSGALLGIIHRDISPQNVLLSYEGDVKVIDFGIAKVKASSQSTAAGIIKGKFFYMSPEQARGLALDHRSDIFSVGALLYELLTLRMLYDTDSINDALRLAKRGAFLPPSTHRPDLPDALDRIVLKALAREREQRYQTADELRRDLAAWLRKAAPGFGRHRLEAHIRDLCGVNTQIRLARMRRDEFRVAQHRSMIVRDDPTGERTGPREPDAETREISPSVRPRKELAPVHQDETVPPASQAADALARRIRDARRNLRWTDEHDVPAGLADPTVESQERYDLLSRSTTLTQMRSGPAGEDGGPTRPRPHAPHPPDRLPAQADDDTTERDPARRRTTGPVPTAPPTPERTAFPLSTPSPDAPTRPVAGRWVPPSVLEAEALPFGEQTDIDATVVDPGPLARALEEAEAVMRVHEADPTPVGGSSGPPTSPWAADRERQRLHSRDRKRPLPAGAARPAPAPAPTPAARHAAPLHAPERRAPAASAPPSPPPGAAAGSLPPTPHRESAARPTRPAPAASPGPPGAEALPRGPSNGVAAPIQRPDPGDDFSDATWPEPISGAPPQRRPRSLSRGALVVVGAAVLAIGVALGFLIGPSAVEPVPDGRLFITSRPRLGARIFLDGQETAWTTPAVIHQLAGNSRHTVRGSLSGYREATVSDILVAPGTQTEVVLHLEPLHYSATLESTPAGADIIINGRIFGRTPTTLRGLSAADDGTLTVLLRLPQHLDSVFTLRWSEGETHISRSQTLTRAQ
jgi:eukaryotic-like serine/threonine-protein kinase